MSTDIERHQSPAAPVLDDRTMRLLDVQAKMLARSSLVPKELRGKPDDVLAVISWGFVIGLTPAVAVQSIYLIDGRPWPSALAVVAAANARGHRVQTVKASATECTVRALRRGDDPSWAVEVTYTIEDAKRAGLLDIEWRKTKWDAGTKTATVLARWKEGDGPKPEWVKADDRDVRCSKKDNWHNAPTDMLFARASRRAVKMIAPEVLLGMAELGFVVDDDPPATYTVTATVDQPAAIEAAVVPQWADSWRARCKDLGCDVATSKLLIHYATQGLTVLSTDVPEGMRGDCDVLLGKWAQDRPADVQAWLDEPEAE